jgi:hypothetical protein
MRVPDGDDAETWSPQTTASPEATPTSITQTTAQDLVAWSSDSGHVAFWLSDLGLFIADAELNVQAVPSDDWGTATALAWSPSGLSLAIGLWLDESRSAVIRSIALESPNADPGQLMATAEGDGRFVRSLAWGNEQVGILFALRSVGEGSSAPNDLYMVPRFGDPMRLVASAGVAAPAAAIDQIALAQDGKTIAFTVLVPGEVGLRLHSLWVTDATAPRPVQVPLEGVRRVNDLAWGEIGLILVGTRRIQGEDGVLVQSVVEAIGVDSSENIVTESTPATPVASPASAESEPSTNATSEP